MGEAVMTSGSDISVPKGIPHTLKKGEGQGKGKKSCVFATYVVELCGEGSQGGSGTL